jgi:hypothetical protein
VRSAEQFRPSPPPSLTSEQYTQEYNEVKALGSLNSTARTPAQTQLAHFWSENFFAQCDRMMRGLAETHLDNSGDIARMYALAWISCADGFITTFAAKRHYNFWRPITAIQEGNTDGNPDTVGDPHWQPFANTPNYSDQSSGANAVMASITSALAHFFGTDQVACSVTSTNPNANPNVRNYARLSDITKDIVEVRICQGIHFRYADMDGRNLGRHVAKWVSMRALRPLD